MDLPNLSPQKEDQIYRNSMRKLEENVNTEAILKLHLRIQELENKLLDQHQFYQKRELELHKQFDQKKYKWILKYLEIKVQLEKLNEVNSKTKKSCHQDVINLYNIVHTLLEKLKSKNELQITDLKILEKDIVDSMATLFNPINKGIDLEQFSIEEEATFPHYSSPTTTIDAKVSNRNKESCLTFSKREQIGTGFKCTQKTEIPIQKISNNNGKGDEFSIDSDVYVAAVESKQDFEKENKFTTPQTLGDMNSKRHRDFKGYFRNIYRDSISHTRSTSLNSITSLTSFMEPIHKKINECITKMIDEKRKLEFEFEDEIKKVLNDIEKHLKSEQRGNDSLVSADQSLNQEKHKRINSNIETKKTKENSISKVYAILENNITPNHQNKIQNSRHQGPKEGLEKSNRVIEKLWNIDDIKESHNKVEKDIIQILQELQNSLTLSDREVLLNTLANAQEKGLDLNEIKFEELLAVPPFQSKDQSSKHGFTPSLCMKHPLHVHKEFGQYRNYSSYDRGLPPNSKSSQIINNNLSQQKYAPSQMSMESRDIIDARKYLDSYYNREYFRNNSESFSECSIEVNSRFKGDASELRNLQEKILRENMSPILPPKEKSRTSRMDIYEGNFGDSSRNRQIFDSNDDKENVFKENILKSESDNKISSETNGTANLEPNEYRVIANKQQTPENADQVFDQGKNKNKPNSLFCFRVCGNQLKE